MKVLHLKQPQKEAGNNGLAVLAVKNVYRECADEFRRRHPMSEPEIGWFGKLLGVDSITSSIVRHVRKKDVREDIKIRKEYNLPLVKLGENGQVIVREEEVVKNRYDIAPWEFVLIRDFLPEVARKIRRMPEQHLNAETIGNVFEEARKSITTEHKKLLPAIAIIAVGSAAILFFAEASLFGVISSILLAAMVTAFNYFGTRTVDNWRKDALERSGRETLGRALSDVIAGYEKLTKLSGG